MLLLGYAAFYLHMLVFLMTDLIFIAKNSKVHVVMFIPFVFIVMVNEADLPGSQTLVQAVTWTVLLSVILHGITANPFANAYARRVNARGETV